MPKVVISIKTKSKKLRKDSVFLEMDIKKKIGKFRNNLFGNYVKDNFNIKFNFETIKKRFEEKGFHIDRAVEMSAVYRFNQWFWLIEIRTKKEFEEWKILQETKNEI